MLIFAEFPAFHLAVLVERSEDGCVRIQFVQVASTNTSAGVRLPKEECFRFFL